MTTCDACTHPGACCSGFVFVGIDFKRATWLEDATTLLAKNGLSFFKPKRIRETSTVVDEHQVSIQFDCSLLGDYGRCTDYENRPRLCRDFKAGSDPLCAMYEHKLKGIPIRVQR